MLHSAHEGTPPFAPLGIRAFIFEGSPPPLSFPVARGVYVYVYVRVYGVMIRSLYLFPIYFLPTPILSVYLVSSLYFHHVSNLCGILGACLRCNDLLPGRLLFHLSYSLFIRYIVFCVPIYLCLCRSVPYLAGPSPSMCLLEWICHIVACEGSFISAPVLVVSVPFALMSFLPCSLFALSHW